MPFVSVYIHFVWSTKDRVPYLENKTIRDAMWQHIRDNGKAKGIFIDFVNGHTDHCHCLVSLGTEQTISKIMQLIKGEAAFWFNKQHFITEKLAWQDEYFAVSVSESALNIVRNYIKNQEEHHKKKTFQQEYDEFLTKYGFQKFQDE
ncbi:IS200/IS605 family transposase [Ferruginibacter paludis]|uniref:IS200/IS605 family transposase n=1 Tax=Ferruginibacter paludis TaxID=1310417 RepID=UPI0025B2C56C|nr:IS200/IS605 family transposase [Ferruginibacter paludis]MDN3657025.1 IS200/IS605 family transposase [Ferruginibacter paludis]